VAAMRKQGGGFVWDEEMARDIEELVGQVQRVEPDEANSDAVRLVYLYPDHADASDEE